MLALTSQMPAWLLRQRDDPGMHDLRSRPVPERHHLRAVRSGQDLRPWRCFVHECVFGLVSLVADLYGVKAATLATFRTRKTRPATAATARPCSRRTAASLAILARSQRITSTAQVRIGFWFRDDGSLLDQTAPLAPSKSATRAPTAPDNSGRRPSLPPAHVRSLQLACLSADFDVPRSRMSARPNQQPDAHRLRRLSALNLPTWRHLPGSCIIWGPVAERSMRSLARRAQFRPPCARPSALRALPASLSTATLASVRVPRTRVMC